MANWTEQDGGGRPLNKGTGKALSDPSAPLTGFRSFNRISGPERLATFPNYALEPEVGLSKGS